MKPLGLPTGSVRAILAIALVAAVIGLAYLQRPDKDVVTLAAVAVTFYFASRKS
jgi:hypothetical protein